MSESATVYYTILQECQGTHKMKMGVAGSKNKKVVESRCPEVIYFRVDEWVEGLPMTPCEKCGYENHLIKENVKEAYKATTLITKILVKNIPVAKE